MCNTFAVYFQIFATFGYKKVKNSDNECNSLSLSSFSETKMRTNVTQKRHPTLSGNEKRRICIPKVQKKSSCACRIAFLK